MKLITKGLVVLLSCGILSCSGQAGRYGNSGADLPPANGDAEGYANDQSAEDTLSTSNASDSLPAEQIDDETVFMLGQAEEYYAAGVAANQEKDWTQAQYNFEKAIEALSSLDVFADGDTTIEAQTYRVLMKEITADYKLTLFNLNVMSDDVSPYALDEKFRLLDSLSSFSNDTIVTLPVIADTITYDMPIVLNDRVKKWIIYFQTSARKNFERSLARSTMYIPIMEKILEEEGLPHDLVYLPMIESGFAALAYSYAHAAGFWQFMSYTARDWDLKTTYWHDERYDFEKSTHAAAQYLKSLFDMFGDWRHALTAYNGGPLNVQKMIKKNPGKDYWEWDIRNSQMRNFVPKFMAAAIIAKQPERYGFDVEFAEPLEYDVITIDRCLYLKDIAEATSVSEKKIRELNPELRRDYTPPNQKKYRLRIPKNRSGEFLAAYPEMKSPKETAWEHHKITQGETIATIAKKYGVSQSAIAQANNLKSPYRIYKGETLTIPIPADRSAKRGNESVAKASYEVTGEYYVVKPADNLWNLGRAFGTTAEKIRQLNKLPRNATLYVGQKLKIPGKKSEEFASEPDPPSPSSDFVHKVKSGQTLSIIAKQYGMTVDELCRLNGLTRRSTLAIGQELKVSARANGQDTSAEDKYMFYTVKKGDTLGAIARAFTTTIREILNLNSQVDPDRLRIGEKLKIKAN